MKSVYGKRPCLKCRSPFVDINVIEEGTLADPEVIQYECSRCGFRAMPAFNRKQAEENWNRGEENGS